MIKFKHYANFKTEQKNNCSISQYIPVDDLFAKLVSGKLTELKPEDFGDITSLPEMCLNGGTLGAEHTIKRVEFPDTITRIPNYFMQWYNCDEVVFPPYLEFIGHDVFFLLGVADFSKVKSIPLIDTNNTSLKSFSKSPMVIKVPAALYDTWLVADDWLNAVNDLSNKLVSVEG
jgi:hypothetical protein